MTYSLLTYQSLYLAYFQKTCLYLISDHIILIMMLHVQDDNSDGSLGSPTHIIPQSKITWKTNLNALFYKSTKVQQRNYCANICQLITPLLCVAFTMVIKTISSDIITSKIEKAESPVPFNFPILYNIVPLNISCEEIYFYDYEGVDAQEKKAEVQEFVDSNLKRYCKSTKELSPRYLYKDNMNVQILKLFKNSEKEKFQNGHDMKAPIPDGILKFHQLSPQKLNVTVGINDYRLSEYHRNNGVTKLVLEKDSFFVSYLMTTEGMMSLIEKVTRPFLQKINDKQIIFGSYMYMPFSGTDNSLINKTINVIGTGLYPLGLALLLPLFLYSIVSQKEEKLIQIMRMNGLNIKYYWVNMFFFNFLVSMLTFSLFYIFGYFVLELQFFTDTSILLMWLLLVAWAIAQISMTSFVQIFISNAKSATIIGYLLSIFSSLVGETLCVFVYSSPLLVPNWLLLYPPVSLCRAFYLIGMACSTTGCIKRIDNMNPELNRCLLSLFSWFFVFLISIWLNDKVQQEYGVSKSIGIVNCLKRIYKRNNSNMNEERSEVEFELKDTLEQKGKIDLSVERMKKQVMSYGVKQKNLIIKDLCKKYETTNGKNDYVALKPFTFSLQDKEIFGLLGPNGAGKTTLISVLTGMYPKTQGNAWINGLQVGNGEANQFIGVCPQFDLLWPSLTVYEHLKFYALLKGIQKESLEMKINESLRDVDLVQWKNKASQQLSGGMQRRLSIAIALVSNPSVVFLDEPSSGLDPSHRRKLWNILKRCKQKTSIILTTHLMEQAEALCDRVGIIAKGELRCIGETSQLKNSLGQGYRLFINFLDLLSSDNQKITMEIQQKFNAKVLNLLDSRVVFKVEKQKIFECVSWLKHEKSINWLVSQPSLYDVFMDFVE